MDILVIKIKDCGPWFNIGVWIERSCAHNVVKLNLLYQIYSLNAGFNTLSYMHQSRFLDWEITLILHQIKLFQIMINHSAVWCQEMCRQWVNTNISSTSPVAALKVKFEK